MSFTKHTIYTEKERSLFNSEIESLIIQYAEENKLSLPKVFDRRDYEFFFQQCPTRRDIQYEIVFLARPKTADEILGDQIEFQIKQLES